MTTNDLNEAIDDYGGGEHPPGPPLSSHHRLNRPFLETLNIGKAAVTLGKRFR